MFLSELRSAVRSLGRAKALTAILLVSLGIGTGANAAVFGVIRALLFRAPDGVEAPARLVSIYTSQYDGSTFGPSSVEDFQTIASSAASLDDVAAVDDRTTTNASVVGYTAMVRVARVSENFFALLGTTPHAGRLLQPGDATATAPAVISYALWESAGRPEGIIGQTVVVRGEPHTIVGIAPPRFRGLQTGRWTDVWLPLDVREAAGRRGDRWLSLIARLRLSATVDVASTELDVLSRDLAERFPETNRGTVSNRDQPRRITAVEYSLLQPDVRTQTAWIAWLVTAAVVLLLAGACVNAGTLLLSRGFARRRDLAVKMAFGASRERLVRELLAESLVISLGAAAIGLLFAHWTRTAIPALFSPDHAALLDTGLEPDLIIATFTVACLAGTLFGSIPAFHATSAPAVTALRADAGGISDPHGGRRVRAWLVGAQVALSTVLLLGTAMMVGSLRTALNADAVFRASHVAVVSAVNPGLFADPLRGLEFHARVAERLRKTDGVRAFGWAGVAPLVSGTRIMFRVQAGSAALTEGVELDVNVVSPTYFETLAMPLVEGRPFTSEDQALSSPVAIVDEAFARNYFGDTATGDSLAEPDGTQHTIVGVVRMRRFRTMQQASRPTVFFPVSQRYQPQGHLFVVTSAPAAAALEWLPRMMRRIDDGVRIERVVTLERHLTEALAIDRLTTTLVATCGVLALFMAMIGVYGVMNDGVQRRTREIGLRVALGAARRQVASLVFAEVAWLAAAGFAAGAALAAGIERWLRSAITTPPSLDVVGLSFAPALMACIIALASVIPLRRALRVSAATALRAE